MSNQKLKEYNFDVAFSFHSKDQIKATRINNLLKDRYDTFLYTEKQKELIGANGEEKFKNVFQFESRVVVVFYCKEWGNTPWTRVESDAIRARGHEKGYEFLILIPTESDVPKWLPPTFIWANLKRYGINGAASAIENKIQLLKGEKKDLTPKDIAKWIENRTDFIQRKTSILNSYKGIAYAREEMKLLFETIEKKTQDLKNKSLVLNFNKQNESICFIDSTNISMKFEWKNYVSNYLEDRSLIITINELVDRYQSKPKVLKSYKLLFDYSEAEEFGWLQEDNEEVFFTSSNLVDFVLKEFLKIIYDRMI